MEPADIVAAVAAAIQFYKEQQALASAAEWQADVGAQLQAIMSKLDDIENLIQQLPGVVAALLKQEKLQEWATYVNTSASNAATLVQQCPKGPTSQSFTDDWSTQLRSLRDFMKDAAQYQQWSFAGFPIVAAALVSATRLTSIYDPENIMSDMLSVAKSYFSDSADSNIASSFQSALNSANSAKAHIVDSVNPILNVDWANSEKTIGGFPIGRTGQVSPSWTEWTGIEWVGSLDSGIREIYPVTTSKNSGAPPTLPGPADWETRLAYYRGMMASYHGVLIQIDSASSFVDAAKSILASIG